jgi:hypothetical protein
MRFSFSGERGSTKVHKPVKFPPTLTIPVKLLASPPAPGEVGLSQQAHAERGQATGPSAATLINGWKQDGILHATFVCLLTLLPLPCEINVELQSEMLLD